MARPQQNPEKSRPCYGIDKALGYLRNIGGDAGRRSVQMLARDAGVSYVTMWKALRRPQHARRPAAAASPAPQDTLTGGKFAAARLARRMQSDLLQGRLPQPGPLPGIKELCSRYHAGYRLMRKALDALCAEGLLACDGSRFSSRAVRARPSLTIAILVYAWYEGPLVLMSEYDQDYMRSLEAECSGSQLGLQVMRYSHTAAGRSRTVFLRQDASGHTLAAGSGIDGYAVLVFAPVCLSEDLFAQLHATGKPVVFIDQIGGWTAPPFLNASGRCITIQATDYAAAGRGIVQNLLGLGHRRCAFFSAYHADAWSRLSYDVMQAACHAGGPDCSLTPFVAEGSVVTAYYISKARSRAPDKALHRSYATWKRGLPAAYSQQLDPYFAYLLEQQLAYAEVRQTLDPLFRRAVSDKSITCWITADVDSGWFAHDFLRARSWPGSLLAIGSSPELIRFRVASWDFNPAAAARATVGYLLDPRRRLPGQEGHALAIQGTLIDRGSLKRAS